ncbi:MAG: acyltransferase family protein, partial [Pyrinomonadaceae bacterium]
LMIVTHSSNSRLTDFFTRQPLRWIGTISYSLYLWNPLFLSPFQLAASSILFPFPINFILLFLFGWASFGFIEKPFLRLRDRFLNWLDSRSQAKEIKLATATKAEIVR